MKRPLLVTLLPLFVALATSLQALPPVAEGMTRHVVDPGDQPEGAKVEIIVGKTAMTDGVNHYELDGRLEEMPDSDPGSHLVFRGSAGVSMTLLPVPPDAEKKEVFVTTGDDGSALKLYDTERPIAVDVPEDCEVRYRIWTPFGKMKPVPEG